MLKKIKISSQNWKVISFSTQIKIAIFQHSWQNSLLTWLTIKSLEAGNGQETEKVSLFKAGSSRAVGKIIYKRYKDKEFEFSQQWVTNALEYKIYFPISFGFQI